MYICVCKAVTDTRIRTAVERGSALTLRDLTRELSVGTGCGKCVPAARELLDRTRNRHVAPPACVQTVIPQIQTATA